MVRDFGQGPGVSGQGEMGYWGGIVPGRSSATAWEGVTVFLGIVTLIILGNNKPAMQLPAMKAEIKLP